MSNVSNICVWRILNKTLSVGKPREPGNTDVFKGRSQSVLIRSNIRVYKILSRSIKKKKKGESGFSVLHIYIITFRCLCRENNHCFQSKGFWRRPSQLHNLVTPYYTSCNTKSASNLILLFLINSWTDIKMTNPRSVAKLKQNRLHC